METRLKTLQHPADGTGGAATVPPVTAGRRLKIAVKNALGLRGVKQVRLLAGPARGVCMTLDFAGHTPMYLGMYEWELHRFIRQALPDAHLVFDVGGYIGYDTLLFAANTTGDVVTFEPNRDNRNRLDRNLALNPPLYERVTVEPLAIGGKEHVGTTTLDAMTSRFGPPDLIKIDIDGGELEALRGGTRTLRERHPHLIVETHSKQLEDDCAVLLIEHGYRPVIKHNRSIWREQRGGAPHNRWLLASGSPAVPS
jgi:methyltransferase FkbM-like protein